MNNVQSIFLSSFLEKSRYVTSPQVAECNSRLRDAERFLWSMELLAELSNVRSQVRVSDLSKEAQGPFRNTMLKSIKDCMVRLEVEEFVMEEIWDLLQLDSTENTSQEMME